MSTNHYLSTPDKAVRDKYLKDYTLTDEPTWGYEIHIAKVSGGWVPLFQAHDGAFNSYAELRKLVATGLFTLYDEYCRILTWDEFDNIIHSWLAEGDSLQTHLTYEYNQYGRTFKDSEGYEFFRGEFC